MKKARMKKWFIFLTVALLSIAMSFSAFGADSDFEAEIKDFPESYKPYLRELHEKYPEWSFVPMITGLTWQEVVNGEISKPTGNKNDKKSLVAAGSVTSDIFKSTSSYDYNQSTGVFKQWDGGFVAASNLAVSYFMDPRNFLTEENIFQFELLAFDERHTLEAIEYVLSGSFMAEKKITYYNSSGEKKTVNKTYAEAIHEAGEKYNINPCYLASKILNEVGTKGSSSVSGKHSTYPGIYNFYNIGATDGSGAIARGLKWASSGSTYSRPWNTPVKSINGGAEYLAETYIKNGQFTGYLQKFNVNPDAYYGLYTHQYMTNLTGALTQGYSTYTSYVKSGLLNNNYVFSIPVFENMPESDGIKAYAVDSISQKGKISVNGSNVRTGPSTYNAKLLDSYGYGIQLSSGTAVTILECVETDTHYYGSILTYPYWYKVKFTYNSESYTGYVPAGFVDITTKVQAETGKYDISFVNGGNGNMSLTSLNESIIKVVDSDTVEFVKSGTATLVAYDSTGNMSKVLYKASSSPSLLNVEDLAVTTGTNKAKITFTKGEDKTELILCEYGGNLLKSVSTENESYTFKSLTPAGKYTVMARSTDGTNCSSVKSLSFAVPPSKVTGLKYSINENDELVLTWDEAASATGYAVYCYNSTADEYTRMATVKGKTTYTVPEEYIQHGTYCIKAYISFNGKNTYSALSDKLSAKEKPATPAGLKVSDVTETGYTLSWDSVKTAEGYEVYSVTADSMVLSDSVSKTEYKVSSLKAGSEKSYRVRAYVTKNDKRLYSDYSNTVTALTKPSKVTGLKSTSVNAESAVFSWKAAAGADAYELYVCEKDGKKQLLGTVDTTEVTAEGLKQNTQYTLYVASVAKTETASEKSSDTTLGFITKLSLPENIKVTFTDITSATIHWDKNSEAESYELYRYDEEEKEYGYYKTVTGNSLTLKYLVPEKQYLYILKAVGKKPDGSDNQSIFSAPIIVKSEIPAFNSKITASNITDDSYVLSWKGIDDALRYNIYEVSGKTYKKIASTSKTSYSFELLGESCLKEYAVSAVYDIGSEEYESKKSEVFSVSTKPAKVKTLKATAGPNEVSLKWSKVKNASYYKVYLYDSTKEKYVEKKKLTGTSYTLSSLGYAKKHKVRVRAFIKSDAGTVSSALTTVSFRTLPKDIANVKLSSATTTSQTLKWSKSTGATDYYVYRYNSSTDSYKRIAKTSETSITVKNLKKGTKYSYKIRPVVIENGKTVLSGNATKAYRFSTK
ncbi:MAG: fibronectin type III domain-containing protein [Clostridia bacterium]|nr:fibronectin type III domain-containing protein [Clostridia bacterium]